jgi:hypothetical protein
MVLSAPIRRLVCRRAPCLVLFVFSMKIWPCCVGDVRLLLRFTVLLQRSLRLVTATMIWMLWTRYPFRSRLMYVHVFCELMLEGMEAVLKRHGRSLLTGRCRARARACQRGSCSTCKLYAKTVSIL